MSRRGVLLAGAAVLLTAGSIAIGKTAYLEAKGVAAGVLVDRALAANLADGGIHRPWSWADTSPVAEIEVEALRVRRAVLSGATGSSLAFGLGHLEGTPLPGERGNCAVAGHRDTWAAFLRELTPGDVVRVRTHRGVTVYRVTSIRVARESDPDVMRETDGARLTLITCYPFSGILKSPWRYVVVCDALAPRSKMPA